jgi:hypothetical protein
MLNDDETAVTMLKNWYDICGYETTEEAVEAEVALKTFLTAEEAGQTDFGAQVIAASEFMVERDSLSRKAYDVIKSNFKPDVLEERGV